MGWAIGGWTIALMLGTPTVVDGPSADRARIQRHLQAVEAELRAASTTGLSPGQQAARAAHIATLRAYWERGRFPRNRDFPGERRPYFIDDDDTACAVGYLMIESGAADLARQIHDRENNALVADITTEGVAAWADAAGLTVAELARIQPNYCFCDPRRALVCGVDGVTYGNACVATECAGVKIDHEGPCATETGSQWPEPMATSGTDGTTSGGGASSGSTSGEAAASTSVGPGGTSSGGTGPEGPSATTTGAPAQGTATGDATADDGGGCRIQRPRLTTAAWLPWLVLGLRRRRRCAR